MKVFKLNDCDWVAAETLHEAYKCLSENVHDGTLNRKFFDEFIDDPQEVSVLNMQKLRIYDEDDHKIKISFQERLQEMIDNDEKFPCFFASTEY